MHLKEFMRGVFMAAIALSVMGCGWPAISGRVVDDVTGKPIEGAVVMAHWTKTTGIGLTSTKVFDVHEALTDANGEFRVAGIFRPLLNHPDVTIYKKGYVCWYSFTVFPRRNRRMPEGEIFPWRSGQTYRLEPFKEEYSYTEHTGFISHANGFDGHLMRKAYEWELDESTKELNRKAGIRTR